MFEVIKNLLLKETKEIFEINDVSKINKIKDIIDNPKNNNLARQFIKEDSNLSKDELCIIFNKSTIKGVKGKYLTLSSGYNEKFNTVIRDFSNKDYFYTYFNKSNKFRTIHSYENNDELNKNISTLLLNNYPYIYIFEEDKILKLKGNKVVNSINLELLNDFVEIDIKDIQLEFDLENKIKNYNIKDNKFYVLTDVENQCLFQQIVKTNLKTIILKTNHNMRYTYVYYFYNTENNSIEYSGYSNDKNTKIKLTKYFNDLILTDKFILEGN